jgi:4-hydroxybenzoate polyprenyltransferase
MIFLAGSNILMLKMLRNVFISMRPKQWYKNSLLFICLVFAGHLGNGSMWATLVLAAVYFCLLSGCEYIINDILDREQDRKHPRKSNRPIASGQLGLAAGFTWFFVLTALSLAGSYFTIGIEFFTAAAIYVILILLYSILLKHQIIADVIIISLGFVLRAVAGCLAIDVIISPWLIICTFLLALFLALEKRWSELSSLEENAGAHRSTLFHYSRELLDKFTAITTGATIVSYLIYTTLGQDFWLITTAPFAIYGVFRYMYLVHERQIEGEPVAVFRDKPLLIDLSLWVVIVIILSLTGALV